MSFGWKLPTALAITVFAGAQIIYQSSKFPNIVVGTANGKEVVRCTLDLTQGRNFFGSQAVDFDRTGKFSSDPVIVFRDSKGGVVAAVKSKQIGTSRTKAAQAITACTKAVQTVQQHGLQPGQELSREGIKYQTHRALFPSLLGLVG